MTRASSGLERVEAWVRGRGWSPHEFQREAWRHALAGRSGLIQVATGAGKTYAAFLGQVARLIDDPPAPATTAVLYVTPLRAVTRDVELALAVPLKEMGLGLRVESRTGDTTSAARARQRERPPAVLVTTPESLALMLTHEQAPERLAHLRCVIVDEWHELLTNKRGSLLELCLSRVRAWSGAMQTWGMSATLPNAEEALCTLLGTEATRERRGVLVRAEVARETRVRSVLPGMSTRLPWAGHLGLSMLPDVLAAIDPAVSTIVFTNTRSQAERWFHAIAYNRPSWSEHMALHHGSLDREERARVEAGLKGGSLRLVVATSSLDLGVDFAPVERVLQIGSVKGIARVVQRAGRASHRPGVACEVLCVPTHQLELLEIAAAREAIALGELEDRVAPVKPLDVLAQHIVTCAAGGGFRRDELVREVRGAWSFRDLTDEEFDWALRLVHDAGVLRAYPQFRKVTRDDEGVYRATSPRIAQIHRLNVGTITMTAASLEIRLRRGRSLGQIDETFVTNLRPHQRFVFAGKVLEFLTINDEGVVIAQPARGTSTLTPAWSGTRLPISESLAQGLRRALERAASDENLDAEPELRAARRLVLAQQRHSVVPTQKQTLIELTATREGTHAFIFPFEGRLVHAGIAAVLAARLTKRRSASLAISANDYGFELRCDQAFPFQEFITRELFTTDQLVEDMTASAEMSQLARLAFREVARIAGLVPQQYPGARKTGRQLQVSSGLMFDVLREHDPSNLLLEQARREVLERHFEHVRLSRTLERIAASELLIRETARATPLSFPLIVERQAAEVSTQTLLERVEQMMKYWEAPPVMGGRQ